MLPVRPDSYPVERRAAPPRGDAPEPTLRDLTSALLRHRLLLILSVLVATGLGVAYTLYARPVYEATSVVRFEVDRVPGGQLFRFPLIGIAVYGLLANLCYCGGWAIEMTLNRLWGEKVAPVGPVLFRQGLIFSVGLSLLPIIIAGLGWIARVFLALIH